LPRKKKHIQPERQAILDALDPEVKRIKVKTNLGKARYKAPDQLADEDIIVLRPNGKPYTMKTEPGRKRKPVLEPANAAVAVLLDQKEKALASDGMLNVTKDKPESSDVLHQAMIGLAEEAASIGFERKEAERKGEATSQISGRRVNALKAVVDTWLKRKEQLQNNVVDMESPGFQVLFKFIAETFKGAMEESEVHPEMIKVVFSRFIKQVGSEDWKNDAKSRMRNNV